MENEVIIVVKARNETRGAFASVERDARTSGDRSGDSFRTGLSGKMMSAVTSLGDKVTSGLADAAAKLPGILGSAASSIPPQGQVIALALVGGLAAALAPMIGAALSAAVLLAVGGGVLAAGILSAVQDPKVKKAFGKLGEQAKGIFKDFGEPFRQPLIRAAGLFSSLLADLKPQINQLGVIIAPLIDQLAPALAGFLKAAMPGIKDAVTAAVPLFQVLAEKLPGIGSAISDFFSSIADNGPSTAQFFGDMLVAIANIIRVVGKVIGWLVRMYAVNRSGAIDAAHAVGWVVDKISDLIGWIRHMASQAGSAFGSVVSRVRSVLSAISGTIAGIVSAVRGFVARIKALINGIPKLITIDIVQSVRTIGSGILHGLGFAHGGIVGAASGGVHSGLRMVGEHGPELAELPPGTRIHSNPDTQRMMSGGNGGGAVTLVVQSGGSKLDDLLVEILRNAVRVKGAGSVQTLLGKPGMA